MRENKIKVQVLTTLKNQGSNRDYDLPPGKYTAELNKNGTLMVCHRWGYVGGLVCYIPKPDQFEFIDAPPELVGFWQARNELVKAQGEYEAAWQKYQQYLHRRQ